MMKRKDTARAHIRRLLSEGSSWTLSALTDNGRFREDTVKQYITDLKNPVYSGGAVRRLQRLGEVYFLEAPSTTSPKKGRTPNLIVAEPFARPEGEIFYTNIWSGLIERLEAWDENWKLRVDETAVTGKRQKRTAGEFFLDPEVMEAACLSIFSAQIDWQRIQSIKLALEDEFAQYNVAVLAAWDDADLEEKAIWFFSRKSGSQGLRANLRRIREIARKFLRMAERGQGLDAYFSDHLDHLGNDPILLSAAIGTTGEMKMPGMGVPLAAEFLRNLGHDLSKPDIHIMRAAGCFGFVTYKNWQDRSVRRGPPASLRERVQVMRSMDHFAKEIGVTTTYLDSVIWTACSKSGAWLSNAELTFLTSTKEN
jgi:hypothetical protein